MYTYKATAGFDIFPESQPLGVCVENVVVGAGENKQAILLQVGLGHNRRVTGSIYPESILLTELLNAANSGRNIIMNISFSVFSIDQYGELFPVNLVLRRRYQRKQEKDNGNFEFVHIFKGILFELYMRQKIAHVALVVKDYDEAIQFYTEKLDFRLVEDTKLSGEKRWVLVAPPGAEDCCLLLTRAANDQQMASVGNQTGGRVFLFLYTEHFWRDYNKMRARNIHFVRPPKEEDYGIVAVFEDLYGNLWDLLQPNESS